MKKLLLVLAVAAFASCGGGESTETATDSTVTPAPDTTVVTPAPDTTAVKDSTVADTTKK